MSTFAPPSWEKRGNTAWVACRACRTWFPVAPELVAQDTIALGCPGCGRFFAPDEAGEIEQP